MSKNNDVAHQGFQREAFLKEKTLSFEHSFDETKFVGANPNGMCELYYEREAEKEATNRKETLKRNDSIEVYSARNTSRKSSVPESARSIHSSRSDMTNSARDSARSGSSTDRSNKKSARDTVAELRDLSNSGRLTTRLSSRPLDSIRSDMSTGRLENSMKTLYSEKQKLLQQLAKVEEELGNSNTSRTGRKSSARSSAR